MKCRIVLPKLYEHKFHTKLRNCTFKTSPIEHRGHIYGSCKVSADPVNELLYLYGQNHFELKLFSKFLNLHTILILP